MIAQLSARGETTVKHGRINGGKRITSLIDLLFVQLSYNKQFITQIVVQLYIFTRLCILLSPQNDTHIHTHTHTPIFAVSLVSYSPTTATVRSLSDYRSCHFFIMFNLDNR